MKEFVAKIIKSAIDEKKIVVSEEEIISNIEIPPSIEMGDYAFPCFFLAKKFRESPNEIALELREKIRQIPKEFEDIQTSGPYINFFLNRKEMAKKLIQNILEQKNNFGKSDIGKGETILIEHTSINPNASPHVGRARNALIGDSLVRLFNFLNFKTEVHYYVNDVSKQIAMLVLANAEKLKFEQMLKKYMAIANKVKKSKKLEKKVFDLLEKFEKGDKEIGSKFKKIVSTCVNGQEKILSSLGVHYDFFDYESSYLNDHQNILNMLSKTGKIFKDKDGRDVLNLKGTSIDSQMQSPVLVLTRSNGTGLYPLRDISYTIEKMKRAGKNIIVLGEDQKLYFQQIKETLILLGEKSPEVVHYSFILLNKKGKSTKMSTRKGDVVLLDDFLKEAIDKAKKEILKRKTKGEPQKIGIGAVKYSILKNNPSKSILFNLDDALSFDGDTGPYILYSYARASSIIRRLKKKQKQGEVKELDQKEIELIKLLSQFPDIVLNSYNGMNPSLIANYSYHLAQLFNEFYHSCPVIGSENESFRIELVQAFRQVLKNSFSLLGIEVLEEM